MEYTTTRLLPANSPWRLYCREAGHRL